MFRPLALIISFLLFFSPVFGGQDNILLIKIGEPIELDENFNGANFEFQNIKIKFEIIKSEDDGWAENAILTIQRESEEPIEIISLVGPAAYANLAIYNFEENTPYIMFQTFSGGAHCCAMVNLVNLAADKLAVEEFGAFDGEFLYPEDIDGDGIYEIMTYDNLFLYSFDAYAFSYPPPIIYAAKDGEFYNASFESRFDEVFLKENDNMQDACLNNDEGIVAGICAGWLGLSARIGRYDEAKELVIKAIEQRGLISGWESYEFCEDDNCEKRLVIEDFIAGVEYALKDWGYLN